MVSGIFHVGSGIGNQLHRYVMCRTLALDKGYEFGMINPENFKGKDFMNIDMGVPVKGLLHEFCEKKVINDDGQDIRPYDSKISEIEDFTLIDGEFQGEKYYEHRLSEIRNWLRTIPIKVPDNVCIMAFRGGEYVGVKDLFLPLSYWLEAMVEMNKIKPMKFRIVTDDVETAKKFFTGLDVRVRHEISEDWGAIRHARYIILSNSSFGILPALLNENAKKIIAPKFWAGYNKGYWQLEQNQYKQFTYI